MSPAPDDDRPRFVPSPEDQALIDKAMATARRRQTERRGLRFKPLASDGVMRRQNVEGLVEISEPALLALPDDRWSAEEWTRIQRGFEPTSQDNHWLALVEGDRLYLYRALSGLGVYQARFEQVGGQWRIAEALIEDNRAIWRRRDDQEDAEQLAAIIRNVLLSGPVSR